MTAEELKEGLRHYLAGEGQPFRDNIAMALRDAHKSSDPNLERLAHEIEWCFCDLERGFPVGEVRAALNEIANRPASLTVVFGKPIILDPTSGTFVDEDSGTSVTPQNLSTITLPGTQ